MAEKKYRGGRKPYEPTDADKKLVRTLSGCGIPGDDICKLLTNPTTGKPIDKKTLYKYYRAELESGHIQANAKVAQNLFNIATGASNQAVTAAIFWLKTRARWSDKTPENNDDDSVEMPTEIIIRAYDVKAKK